MQEPPAEVLAVRRERVSAVYVTGACDRCDADYGRHVADPNHPAAALCETCLRATTEEVKK